ncbi:hypothetical protein RsTz2092_06760 [Deferribacterales bacterium RsTz2092]|nr:hypothetical protein AGMMS49941_10790 [Deferribacterales bacterium]
MLDGTIENLVKLQAIDTKIASVARELDKIPEMLKGHKLAMDVAAAELANNTKSLELERASILQLETALVEYNKDVEEANKKKVAVPIERLEEVDAEIREKRMAIVSVEEKLRFSRGQVERLEEYMTSHAKEATDTKEAYEKEKAQREVDNKGLFDEIEMLKAERDNFVVALKSKNKKYERLVAKYDKTLNSRNNLAVSKVVDGFCTGCYLKLPPELATDIKRGKELIECPYCQRFLHDETVAV